jgi:phosphoenolpyruvate phosphomutase
LNTRILKQLLSSPDLTVLMEAHSGLSARIVADAGFKAIWASGLSISAAMGLRDSNEASWTEVLGVLEQMVDASDRPILCDADSGYGNFNNVRRLARKVAERGVAGICIEDKLFPKTNSFIGDEHPLADAEEFAGKLRAARDSVTDPDFVIVARTEAMIAGFPVEEALRRAEIYRQAGADAVLVHSRHKTPEQIFAFMRHWHGRCPVIVVPTTYAHVPVSELAGAGVSAVIWANHTLRASIRAMQETCAEVFATQTVVGLGEKIVPLNTVFDLTNAPELEAAEQRYLPERTLRKKAKPPTAA